jgi:hypothetical protein
MGSLARFEKKNIVSTLKNALAYYNAGVVAVNSKVVGLAPDCSWNTLSELVKEYQITTTLPNGHKQYQMDITYL